MIDRQHGKLIVECDTCDQVFEGHSGEWSEVWPAAQRDGWRSKKIGDQWVHGCRQCGVR